MDAPSAGTYQSLALRIMMQRISMTVKRGMSATDRVSVIDEVHAYFVKNERLVAADLQSIFG